MSDDDDIQMHPIQCDGLCGRRIGWSDEKTSPVLILCNRCMDHPDEVESRLLGDAS